MNNISVTESISTIDDPVVTLSNKGKEKVVPTNFGPTKQPWATVSDGDSKDIEINVDLSLQNNQFAVIASLSPDQLNASDDMLPVQSDMDLPPSVLPPPVPVDNPDSINLDSISNHATTPSGDTVVAAHSHDIIDTKLNASKVHAPNQTSLTSLRPTATRGRGGTRITNSMRSKTLELINLPHEDPLLEY